METLPTGSTDLDVAIEACAEELWEAMAALTRHPPEVIAVALLTNLEGLLEALLSAGDCSPEDVRRMGTRLSELAANR